MIAWYEENYDFKEDYLASIGERWDLISLAVYERSDLSYIILDANEINNEDKYGLATTKKYTLKIPDIDLNNIEDIYLPAWRRALNEGSQ